LPKRRLRNQPSDGQTNSMKTVGIIGGFGPEATVLFYKELIQECRHAGLKHQPHLVVWNVPVPKKLETDLLIKNTSVKECIPLLTDAAINLERIGADFIILPCNTLHILTPFIRKSITIPFLSIIDTTIMHLHNNMIKRIGLLGTSMTVKHNLFAKADQAIEFVIPSPMLQKIIDCALYEFVSTGNSTPLKKN